MVLVVSGVAVGCAPILLETDDSFVHWNCDRETQMMAKEVDYSYIILKILATIAFGYAIFLLCWRIFGHSPTIPEVTLGVVSLLTALVFANTWRIGRVTGKLDRIAEDIKDMKQDDKQRDEQIHNLELSQQKGFQNIESAIRILRIDISKEKHL